MKKRIANVHQAFSGNTLQSKISIGIAWSFLGTVISKGALLLAFIFVARIITVEDYGQVGIIRNIISTLAMISVASFGLTVTKYLSVYKDKSIGKASHILSISRIYVFIMSFLISICIFLYADVIAIKFMNDNTLTDEVEISAFTVFFTALNGFQNGALSGLEKFKEISFINISNGLLTFPILLIGAYFWQVKGVVIGMAIISVLIWVMSFFYLYKASKQQKLKFSLSRRALPGLIKILKEFSLPAFLSGIVMAPVLFLTNSFLAQETDGYYQLGIFSAAYLFAVLTTTINSIIDSVVYPYAMQQFSKQNKNFEFFNIIFPWFLGIIINLPIIMFPEVLTILFGKNYVNEDFNISVTLIALSSILIAHRQGIARNFAAANSMWWSVLGNGLWGITVLISASYLTSYGSIGLAMAFSVGYILNTLTFIPLYLKLKLVNKNLLLSKETLIIWSIIFMSLSSSVCINSSLLKGGLLVITILIIIYLFIKMRKSYVYTN